MNQTIAVWSRVAAIAVFIYVVFESTAQYLLLSPFVSKAMETVLLFTALVLSLTTTSMRMMFWTVKYPTLGTIIAAVKIARLKRQSHLLLYRASPLSEKVKRNRANGVMDSKLETRFYTTISKVSQVHRELMARDPTCRQDSQFLTALVELLPPDNRPCNKGARVA